ncbi:hypothetical protein [Mesorhizobium sp. CAU 1741]|uniref:aldose epimerase family protein n=1 Tax=Mesorhizobium sp. CAU 1741 TaxID=3140366 RepID=UPI00325C0422
MPAVSAGASATDVRVDGDVFELSRNGGAHHAHGGHNGFGRRNWQAVEAGPAQATVSLHSPDGEEGYPGAVTMRCTVSLADGWLWIELTAQSDRPTPFNPLHHGYFNLDGTGTIAGHRLTIPASTRLEWAEDNCPTGRFVPVEGALDFRHPRTSDPAVGYDISYMLDEKPGDAPRFAGLVESTSGDLAMEVWTTEPGLHFYDGFKLDVPVPGHGGVAYKPRHGLCLEPTRFSDAPNQPAFPDTILRPGAPYRQRTGFRFVPGDGQGYRIGALGSASTPTPSRFAGHLSPARRGKGKALPQRERVSSLGSSPPSSGGEVVGEADRSGGRPTHRQSPRGGRG